MEKKKVEHMKKRREATSNSLRTLAAEFGTSKSTAHRHLKKDSEMAKKPAPAPKEKKVEGSPMGKGYNVMGSAHTPASDMKKVGKEKK